MLSFCTIYNPGYYFNIIPVYPISCYNTIHAILNKLYPVSCPVIILSYTTHTWCTQKPSLIPHHLQGQRLKCNKRFSMIFPHFCPKESFVLSNFSPHPLPEAGKMFNFCSVAYDSVILPAKRINFKLTFWHDEYPWDHKVYWKASVNIKRPQYNHALVLPIYLYIICNLVLYGFIFLYQYPGLRFANIGSQWSTLPQQIYTQNQYLLKLTLYNVTPNKIWK